MRRRPGGFTLIEFGIVLGIAILLMTAISVTINGSMAAARTQRTGEELVTLSRVGVTALRRGAIPNPATGAWSYRATGGATVPLSANAPLCYDLSRVQGQAARPCPGAGVAGPAWSAPYVTASSVPAGSPLLTVLGGANLAANSGYNPWCLPYVICLYPARAEVVTCVPVNDAAGAGLESAMRCGTCPMTSPITSEPTACVLTALPAYSNDLPAVRMSYLPEDYTYLTLPTVYDATVRASP